MRFRPEVGLVCEEGRRGCGDYIPAADVERAPSYGRRAGIRMGVEMILDVGCVACELHGGN